VILNHFAKGSQIQTYKMLDSRTKKLSQDNWHVFLLH